MASNLILSRNAVPCMPSLAPIHQSQACRNNPQRARISTNSIKRSNSPELLNNFKGQSLRFEAVPLRNVSSIKSAGFPTPVAILTERTYVMIKPDGVQRGLVGEIITRFERKGFSLKGLKLFQCPKDLAQEHYKDLKEKSFFPKLVDYIVSGPVVCMVWEGAGSVASGRKLIGATNPLAAEPGTIRGDLAVEVGRNVVHGSDSPENAEREIDLWFKEVELCQWKPEMTPWIRE